MESSKPDSEMITLARESRGLSQAQLAKDTGLAQGTLSRLENGLIDNASEHVQVLSEALGYPESFFYRSGAQYGFGTMCHNRKRQSMPVKKLRLIHAQMNVTRMAVVDLLRGVELESMKIPEFGSDEYESPEEIARMVRQTWQMPTGPVKNVMRSVEAAGGIVLISSFDTDKLDAVSQRPAGQPPFFFANTTAPGDRLRFSMAHELGHIVMHSHPLPDADLEREADRFASEFLMPERDIAADLHGLSMAKLADLKQHWKVSMAALVMRAKHIGAISDKQARSIFVRFSQLGYRKNEPVEIPREEPCLLNDILEFHRTEHYYSEEELRRLSRLQWNEYLLLTQQESDRHLRAI